MATLRLDVSLQTAKDVIQSDAKRYCLTSLTSADETNDVMRDVRTRDLKCISVDVKDQTCSIPPDVGVSTTCHVTSIT